VIYSQFGEIKKYCSDQDPTTGGVYILSSLLLYASGTWTMKNKDDRKIIAFEMRCYKRILLVRWQYDRTNVDIRHEVQREETVMDIIRNSKLRLFGNTCRMPDDRLPKTLMLGMVEGKQQQGRPAQEMDG